jgi:SEC-C motif/Antitoxin Xre/MbcA/ParS C-terminal toxin-binding domain
MSEKIGRNDPCPCGSGKKYKKCCLSNAFVEVGRQETIRRRLVDNLLGFYNKHCRDTLEEAQVMFWDDFVPQQHLEAHTLDIAYQNFFEWITFDFEIDPDENKTLIDLYMEQNRRLTQDEHNVLMIMKNSCISLYEVQEVFPEKGLLLKDLLMGGEYDVKEKAATRGLKRWDILAARLLMIDGQYIMSGSVFPYHLNSKGRILDNIMDEYREYQEDFPGGTMDMFLKESGDIFNFHWYDPIQNPVFPKLHTTTGEPVVLSKAIFDINNMDAVVNTLPLIRGFEEHQDGFTWYDGRKKDGSATVLGRVTIQHNRLILECNSKKRLERGKKLILKAMADAVVHKIDTFQDPMEALKTYKERVPKEEESPENEIPMEIQQQLYARFMQDHYEKWFQDRIPALDNKTPLEAIRTEQGKEKVIELLKLYENGEEQNKKESRPYYDLSWMWNRLGLERE